MPGSRKWLEAALSGHGLRLRGGWIPGPDEAVAHLSAGTAAVVWMVGQVGSECWPAFSQSRFFADGLPDPLDRWSKDIGDTLARACGGWAIYPSEGPPYAPFQQWARRAEPLTTSPLMLQIHPQYGLWHAYRFALAVAVRDPQDTAHLLRAGAQPGIDRCLACDGQPCLSACPVHAFVPGRYDVARCTAHLHAPQGADCLESGCQARRACPVGVGYQYEGPHIRFHMAAFARRRPADMESRVSG